MKAGIPVHESSCWFPLQLIPTLISQPITAFNARALGSLFSVAGSALAKRLANILAALEASSEGCDEPETKDEIDQAIRALFAAIGDMGSLNNVLMYLLGQVKDNLPANRVTGCRLYTLFCANAQIDHSDFYVDWIRQLLSLFDDRDPAVVDAAWTALDALVKTISKEEMEPLSVPLRRTLEHTGSPGSTVSGFCRVNGVKPALSESYTSSPFSILTRLIDSHLYPRSTSRDCRAERAVCVRYSGSGRQDNTRSDQAFRRADYWSADPNCWRKGTSAGQVGNPDWTDNAT